MGTFAHRNYDIDDLPKNSGSIISVTEDEYGSKAEGDTDASMDTGK